jgi:hypothetical protein
MIVLRLEKALGYDDPGWHDLKQQAMRIIDSPHLIDCKPVQGRPAQSKLTRMAQRFCPRGRIFPAQHSSARARFRRFLYAGRMLP